MRSDGLNPPQSLLRGQRSAKPRIKATRNFAQSVCDELAAGNGQTAPENDGGMVLATQSWAVGITSSLREANDPLFVFCDKVFLRELLVP